MAIEVHNGGFIQPAMDPEAAKQYMQKFQQLKAALLSKEDYAEIAGKSYVKRSGYRKFALAFNISDEITKEEKAEPAPGVVVWTIHVKATAPNGRFAVGVAKCASSERKFAHQDHDVYAIAHTRAKNRAISDLIGSGEVSAEEMQAMDANQKAATFFKEAAKK
jgi:hypothetical protein